MKNLPTWIIIGAAMAALVLAVYVPTIARAAWYANGCTVDADCAAYGQYAYCSSNRCYISCSSKPQDGDDICHGGTGDPTTYCQNHICQRGPTPSVCSANCTQMASVLVQCATGTIYYKGTTFAVSGTGGYAGGTCFFGCEDVSGNNHPYNGLNYCSYPAWPSGTPTMTLAALPANLYNTTLGSITGTATDTAGVSQIQIAIRRNGDGGACTAGVTASWNGASWDTSGNGCNAYITLNITPVLSYALAYGGVPPLAQMTDGAHYTVFARSIRYAKGTASAWASAGPAIFHLPANAPTGSATFSGTTCADGVSGTAQDPDSPNTNLTVELLRDGVHTGITTVASLPGHGFLFANPFLVDGVSHTYGVYARGVDFSGLALAPDATLPTVPVTGLSRTCPDTETAAGSITNGVCSVAADGTITIASITGTSKYPYSTTAPAVSFYDSSNNSLMGSATTSAPSYGFTTSLPNGNNTIPPLANDAPRTINIRAMSPMIPSGTLAAISPNTYAVTCNAPPPTVTSIGIQGPANYCAVTQPTATVTWTSTANPQSAYQLTVKDEKNTLVYDSGKTTQTVTKGNTGTAAVPQGNLGYGHTYTAHVAVWNSAGTPSALSGPATLQTPQGQYPNPITFTVSPASLSADVETTFTDTSNYGASVPTIRTWDFGDGTLVGQVPGSGSIVHTYATASASLTASLHVTTNVMNPGDSCIGSVTFTVMKATPNIPTFREVRPGQPGTSPTP